MEKMSILVVDDMKSTEKLVEGCLGQIGIRGEIDMKVPIDSAYPYGCNFPKPSEMDRYDLAFVDLELFPDSREGFEYRSEDLAGGTEILPYIRENAPWLPVFAISRLYDPENIRNHFISFASSFGFDGQIFRRSLRSDTFTRNVFDPLVENAKYIRLAFCMSCMPVLKTESPVIDCGNRYSQKLDDFSSRWREAFRKIFWFAEKLVIEEWKPGFSGSGVIRAFTRLPVKEGNVESQWIIKVNRSATKLHKEAVAHRRMARKGLHHAMMVPLLWPNVVYDNGIAVIGYQFAENTVPASSLLRDAKSASNLVLKLRDALSDFFSERVQDRGILGNVIREWAGKPEYYQRALEKLKGRGLDKGLRMAIDGDDSGIFGSSVDFEKTLIHGDLHCDNIMINREPIFIDFAHSNSGPIVYDVSKLLADILLRVEEFRREEFTGWTDTGLIGSLCMLLRDAFSVKKSDEKLIDIFVYLEFAKAMAYPQTKFSIKKWLLHFLESKNLTEILKM